MFQHFIRANLEECNVLTDPHMSKEMKLEKIMKIYAKKTYS